MLEKLIIELGGVVPKDLLGAGQGELSEISTPSKQDLTESIDLHDAQKPQSAPTALAASDSEGGAHPTTATTETGTDGDGLQGKLEDAMMQRLDQAVQDAEDEADFR